MLIGELAERCGVSTRSLRYYEEQGLLVADRDANGYRRYGDDAVLAVRQVKALLEAGFGTDAIRTILPCATGPAPEIDLCPEVAAHMRRTLATVQDELTTLRRHEAAITGFLEGCAGVDSRT